MSQYISKYLLSVNGRYLMYLVVSTILANVKRRAFLLWSLLTQAGLSFRDVIVVQKSYSGD